jgi:two-component system, LytTR family, response regulator
MLRVMLVDDEKLARQGLRQLLAVHPEVEIVGEAGRALQAAEMLRDLRPEAVFLDIQMPGMNGFELLATVEAPKVVFVTAHSEHAVRAFEVHAVDYLLKPVHPARLAQAIRRLEEACSQQEDTTGYQRGDRICLRTPERTVVAALSEIAALHAEGDFTRIFIADQPPLLICRPLGSYEKILPSPPFVRLSRSLIVNLERITSATHPGREEVTLHFHGIPENFVLGRRPASRLRSFLG